MTCFWSGILQALDDNDFKFLGKKKMLRHDFVNFLKENNKLTVNVRWNGEDISKQEMKENYNGINNFDVKRITNGHPCGTCDLFLLLICELFYVDIEHYYLNNRMVYRNVKGSRKTLRFRSDFRHFWCDC